MSMPNSSQPWILMPALLPDQEIGARMATLIRFCAPICTGKVQAWPKPLTGAGLIHNSLQVAADVAVQKVGARVHED